MMPLKMVAPTVAEVLKVWNVFSNTYVTFDHNVNSFYNTLIGILKLEKANHILEIGCGAGKLISTALEMKNPNATYYATDLCPRMIQILKERLSNMLRFNESKLELGDWAKARKLQIITCNAQEALPFDAKVDRIIANLVINLTEDPYKLMHNLYNHSVPGCLLGMTIWGSEPNNNFMGLINRVEVEIGAAKLGARTNFHLYNKIEELATATGWEVVIVWDTNTAMPYLTPADIEPYIEHILANRVSYNQEMKAKFREVYYNKLAADLNAKKCVNFTAQCAILRRKQ